MLSRVISKRVSSSISEIISQLNNLLVSPAVPEKPFTLHSPVSLRIRYFRHSGRAYGSKLSVSKSTESLISPTVYRFSRTVRTKAQVALFDYLHCTRGFPFADAEHISKHSPKFLQNLLAKVDKDQDVSLALSKFFLYKPINEFEPFFESLGLTQSEFALFLPRNLMFLRDDHVMLENFHVLCNFGVPRSKIGKIYKETDAIFRYEDGILATELGAYEELGLSRSTVIKLVICCPSLFLGGVNAEFVGVLEKLEGIGFEKDWIGGYLSDKKTYNWKSMLDTMNFLTEVGCNETQIMVLFKTTPALLFAGSGKMCYIFASRLLKLGLKMSEVYALFINNPHILSVKCATYLYKALGFLFEIGMDTITISKIVTTHLHLLGSHCMNTPNTVLRNLKVNRGTLCQIIEEDPLKLISLASKVNINIKHSELQKPGRFFGKTTFLLRLGYVENSDEMAKALKQFGGRGDELQERFDFLVKAGVDYHSVVSMVKTAPYALNQTTDMLEKKIEFLTRFLGYPVESIVKFPPYLGYGIGRINLRFSMYVWLRERGAVKPKLRLATLLACSDAHFVRCFVKMHPDGPVMWEKFKNSSPSR